MWWKFLKKEEKANTAAQANAWKSDHTELRESGKAPLTDLAKKVKEIEIATKKRMSTLLSGQYKSRFKGQGMQFSDFRVYQYGDDTRHIDWRASARSQQTYVKNFEEERELNILCVVDISASNFFGTQGATKREMLCLAIANIAFSAIANNDRVGLILFSDAIERYVPPKKGRKHVLRIIDELLSFKAQQKGSNLVGALQFAASIAKHNSIITLASDFFAPFEKRNLSSLAKKHDLIALHIHDPRDIQIPKVGLLELEDPETGETLLIDSNSSWVQKELTASQKLRLKETWDKIQQSGSSLVKLKTTEDPAKSLNQFFHARRKGKH